MTGAIQGGSFGGVVLGKTDTSNLPIQMLTQLVMAETMMTREAEQRQKVEEIAAENARAKDLNDALATIASLREGLDNDKNKVRDPKKNDGFTHYDEINKRINGSGGNPASLNKTADETYSDWAARQPTEGTGAISTAEKAKLTERAKLADLAERYNMAPAGTTNKSYSSIVSGAVHIDFLETLKSKVKVSSEAISSNNQLEMIKLQQLIGAVDAAKTALSQFVKTAADAQTEIVQKY